MTTSTHSDSLKFTKLHEKNYNSWSGDMAATLRREGSWRIVTGTETEPLADDPRLIEYLKLADRAAGTIYLSLEENQKVHIRGMEDKPSLMWETLRDVHLQKKAAPRFNAYDALFSITKLPDESLPSLAARVDDAIHSIKNLRPEKFTLQDLDDELASMTLIRALPMDQFGSFHSSLVLLPQIDMRTLREALQAEENNHSSLSPSLALSSASNSASAGTPSSSKAKCEFCGKDGHIMAKCFKLERLSKVAKEETANGKKKRGGKGKTQANATQETPDAAGSEEKAEFAGNASINPSDPNSPLLCDASSDWMEHRYRRHFSHDSSPSLVHHLQTSSHHHPPCQQPCSLFGWVGFCALSTGD